MRSSLRLEPDPAPVRDAGQAGPEEFEHVVHVEHARLFRALVLITRDPAEAEDVMQEAFLRVWERWDHVREVSDPVGYLYRTAMNVYRSRRRRAGVAVRRAIGFAADRDELAEVEARNEIVRALGALTARQRLGLVLIDLLGYSSKEAGELMRIKAPTARVLASQGRAALKRKLEAGDD